MKNFCQTRSIFLLAALALARATSHVNGAESHDSGAGRISLIGNTPLYFEPNRGQAGNAGQFIARGKQCNIALAPGEALIAIGQQSDPQRSRFSDLRIPGLTIEQSVRLVLEGANPTATMTGLEPMPGKANYLIGSDPGQWQTGVPLFGRVRVDEVYSGVRLIYYANASGQLEYDFVLRPQAEPGKISLRAEGVDGLRLNAAGDLILKIGHEEIRQHRPVIYQEVHGNRQPVEGGYRLIGKDRVGFRIGSYDHNLPLIIDPTIVFSTYLGGLKTENAWAVAVDSANGDLYVAGETLSKNFALPGAFQTNYGGGIGQFGDAFVAKYDGVSNSLVYLTYLGGRRDDGAFGLAVTNGNAFVTGFTDSRDFPLVPTNNPISPTVADFGNTNNSFHIYPVNAFVTELETNGSSLVFSMLVGGNLRDAGTGIALGPTNIYVAGMTESSNFFPYPFPNAFRTTNSGGVDAFVVKLDYTGTTNYGSTFLGGTNTDFPEAMAIDPDGNVYLTGFTLSSNFPVVNPLVILSTNGSVISTNIMNQLNQQSEKTARFDAFVAKLSNDLTGVFYSSYLGGSNEDAGLRIAADTNGNAYATGYTMSTVFPTNMIAQPQSSGASRYTSHAFLIKIGTDVTSIVTSIGTNVVTNVVTTVPYSVEFGSSKSDQAMGIAVDEAAKQVYLAGFTSWTNFFATNVFTDMRSTNIAKKKPSGSQTDIFVAVVQENPDGSLSFTNGLTFGGQGNDQANSLALNFVGTNTVVYIAGQTASRDLPLTNATQVILGNGKKSKGIDAFVGKIVFP